MVTLLRVVFQLFSAMDTHFGRHGLARGRFMVMMNLMKKDGESTTPAALAEDLSVTRATMTGLLDTLETSGFITRKSDVNDRRTIKLKMTAAGKKHMNKMLPDHYQRIAGLMSGLTEAERSILKKLLKKIELGIPNVRDP